MAITEIMPATFLSPQILVPDSCGEENSGRLQISMGLSAVDQLLVLLVEDNRNIPARMRAADMDSSSS